MRNVTVRFNENRDAKEQGAHLATVTLDLLPAEQRTGRVDDILARWRERVGVVPDAVALVFTQGAFGPAGRPIEIRLHGDDLEHPRRSRRTRVAHVARTIRAASATS